MHIETTTLYLEGQIKVHKDLIKVLEDVKAYEPLKAFDMKVINKRINDCFDEFSKTVKANKIYLHYLTFKYYQYKPDTYNLNFCVNTPSGCERYPYKVTNECTVYDIPVIDHKRFTHEGFVSAMDKRIEELKVDLKQLEKELKEVDSIIKEYNRIMGEKKDFMNKYSYYIRQDCKFDY